MDNIAKNPIKNPEFIEAINAMKQDNTPDNRNKMLNEMMRSRFLAPVTIDPPPVANEGDEPVKLEAGSKINFHLITNNDGQKFFMAFTDMDELHKWHNADGQQTAVLTFDDYAGLILNQDSNSDGYVINPFGANLVFPKDLVRSLRERKELIEKERREFIENERRERSNINVSEQVIKKDEVRIGQPKTLPQELLDALYEKMKKMKNISSAYFTLLMRGEIQSFLFVVDFEGDKKEVFDELATVARPLLNGMPISFAEYDSEMGAAATKDIIPFYKKRRGLFN